MAATKTTTKAADEREPEQTAPAPEAPATRDRRECVVDDGTPHMGGATPGSRVCSRHAMRYKADGTPRG